MVSRTRVVVDTVQISGQALLLSRLFPSATPATASDIKTVENTKASGSIYTFLSSTDREILATLYKKGADTGGDLRQIDALAFDLANYRSTTPSGLDKVGTTFDVDGNPIQYAFSPTEEATAQRILTSKAMKDTGVPTDFLNHFLDPGLAPGDHAVDFGALEKMVYALSQGGADGAPDPLAILAPRPDERLAAMQTAGTLPIPADLRGGSGTDGSNDRNVPWGSATHNGDLIAALLLASSVEGPRAHSLEQSVRNDREAPTIRHADSSKVANRPSLRVPGTVDEYGIMGRYPEQDGSIWLTDLKGAAAALETNL